MNTLRTSPWVLCVLVLGASLARAEEEDEAAEESTVSAMRESRTLAERIPSVTGRTFSKDGRVELASALGLSLNDAFFTQVPLSIGVTYGLGEALAIGVTGDYFLGFKSAPDVAGSALAERPPANRAMYAGLLELTWSPIYGKVSAMAEGVLHFDMYVKGGAGLIGPARREASLGFSAALGQHYFINEWIALRVELRDYLFSMARTPKVDKDKDFQHMLTVVAGASFYFPQDARGAE